MGVVSQDPHLFHESIGQNLRYAKPDASVAELDTACAAARILDTIRALPDGYDTVVGPQGYSLSGGQRQRLAIARAILRKARILVLDDAMSAVDPPTEAAIRRGLIKAMGPVVNEHDLDRPAFKSHMASFHYLVLHLRIGQAGEPLGGVRMVGA